MHEAAIEKQTKYVFTPRVPVFHTNGFWISPCGEALEIANGSSHIWTVIRHTEKFRLTKEDIDSWYEEHRENKSQRGDARMEIIKYLVSQRWIRVHFSPRRNAEWFVANVGCDDRRRQDLVTSFFQQLMKKHPTLRRYKVDYDHPCGRERYTVQQICQYALFHEEDDSYNVSSKVVFVESVADLKPVPVVQ